MIETNARCFDGSAPGLRVRHVRLHEITDLLPLTHSEATVASYRSRMIAGDLFPPVSVLPLLGRLVIADGHKRYQAALPLADGPVAVEVWTLGQLLSDQWRQARSNARKNRRIAASLFVRPAESLRLIRSTLQHWVRVARCLTLLFAAPGSRRR